MFVITATLVLTGGLTFYYGEPFEGTPLACPGHTYTCDGTEEPWIALPLEWFGDGTTQCGDQWEVEFSSGRKLQVRALDKCPGCSGARVWDTGEAFVGDLPRCWREGEVTATGILRKITTTRRTHGLRYIPQ